LNWRQRIAGSRAATLYWTWPPLTGTRARPHIANAAATTIEVWFAQGFVPEEDSAFRAMAADYEQASGNKVDHSLIPYAALCQKAISAIASGAVPDMIEVADFALAPIQSWDDKLIDINDVVEPQKEQFIPTALPCCHFYNNVTKKRAYYVVPVRIAAVPFHIWKSLVEQGGSKISDLHRAEEAWAISDRTVTEAERTWAVLCWHRLRMSDKAHYLRAWQRNDGRRRGMRPRKSGSY
jgi:maltose-binding protein MalE